MKESKLQENIVKHFAYEPTIGQTQLISLLADFILEDSTEIFVLKGYAGTGKTTIVSAVINALETNNVETVLLAPTGRAAKILSKYSKQPAYTIHKHIYRYITRKNGQTSISLSKNYSKNAIFFIDEASMIYDNSKSTNAFSSRSLLQDLYTYVFSGKKCKLIFIGDPAQLPPVHLDESPALDINYLQNLFFTKVDTFELDEVVRQEQESGILQNATFLREQIFTENYQLPILSSTKTDVTDVKSFDLEDLLQNYFTQRNENKAVVITRSNKRAAIYNREIRSRIFFAESELETGDLIMVVKNNYFWLPLDSKTKFIANGDLAEIISIYNKEKLYGYHFADAKIRLTDYPDENELEVKLNLDSLSVNGPSLTQEQTKELFHKIEEDYTDAKTVRERIEHVLSNPYYNALQIKFAYSLTCHKTQGGQWETVFVEKGYLTDKMITKEYFRWLYTAITRATKRLFFINFDESFFKY